MMPERITGEARQVVVRAQEHARRLGHGFIGDEHLLYGLAGADDEVGAVLRDRGVTPERVESEFVRLIGSAHPADGDLFDSLDRDALSTIGIDLDVVRERIAAAFGPDALAAQPATPRRLRRIRRIRADRRPRHTTGHLPVTRRATKCLQPSPDGYQVKIIADALLAMDSGMSRRILAAIGVEAQDLRTEINRPR
jgi:hypothetical protein